MHQHLTQNLTLWKVKVKMFFCFFSLNSFLPLKIFSWPADKQLLNNPAKTPSKASLRRWGLFQDILKHRNVDASFGLRAMGFIASMASSSYVLNQM